METNLLDKLLSAYLTGRTRVTITLRNKIRISGRIRAFDGYVVVMESHRREIVYRHAISSLSEQPQFEQKRQPASPQAAPVAPAAPKPQKVFAQKPADRASRPEPLSAAPREQGLNNTLKEGLLKWMREQKPAK